jgi:hypothetical protein
MSGSGRRPTGIDVLIETASEAVTTMTITVGFASDADFGHAVEIGFVDGVARACGSAHSVL